MLKTSIEEALNAQINAEIFSSYLYLSMSSWFDNQGLPGFKSWMETQAQEEMTHATKLISFLQERGGSLVLEAIEKPQASWSDVLDVFKATLRHEQYVTSRVNDLVDLAIAERDHATNNFLQWFVSEQVEEEANVGEILDQIRLMEGSGHGMYMMDKELGSRPAIFTMPAGD